MLPRYVRQYEREIQCYDRMLRIVASLDFPGCYLVERKTRYLEFPDLPLGTDQARQYGEGYRRVFRVVSAELPYIKRSLELCDIQRLGGAKALNEQLTSADDQASLLADRANTDEWERVSSDVYDHLAWAEGRRVSGGL